MKSIRAVLKGRKLHLVFALALLASLTSGLSRNAAAQKAEGSARQAGATRGVAVRKAVINVAELSRKAGAVSPSADSAKEADEGEEVEPPEEIPQNMSVPAGASVIMENRKEPIRVQAGSVTGPSPAASAAFMASDDTGRFPPDTHGAVGPNHLVVVHNGRVRVHNRSGDILSTLSLNGFWSGLGASNPSDIFDPKVLYDPYGGRWMITCVAQRTSASSSVLIGVSQTNDPTGSWNVYRVDADSRDELWADYPSIGFNKNWIVVHVNMFPITEGTGSFASRLFIFNKANLYANGAGLYTQIEAPNLGGTMVPAITYDANLSTLYLLQNWNGNSGGNGFLRLYTITGAVGSESFSGTNGSSTLLVGTPNPWDSGPPTVSGTNDFAPQLGSNDKIQNNDSRIQNVVYRNGSLWTVHTIFLPAGGSATRSAVQWWQVSTGGSIMQRARIEDTTGANFYAFPSIAVNSANDALIGYTRYSSSQYASSNYSFRAGTDPANTMRDDAQHKVGEAPYFKSGSSPVRNRWGDYSNTVVDPANDRDMWTIQEYANTPTGTSDRWATWWTRVTLSAPPAASVLQLSAATYATTESAGRANLTVTRNGDTTQAASVNYATSDTAGLNNCALANGVASSRCDYATSVGTVRFAAGESTKTVSIPVVDDGIAEGNESFTVTLSSASGATLGSTQTVATVTITDNDSVTSLSNPVDQTAFFVRQHYIDFLGREPDAGGYAAWQSILNNCAAGSTACDRVEVSSAFFRSPEFQERGYFIYRFYSAVGRIPLYADFMPDFAKVSGFLSAEQLEANKVAFVNEFMTRDYFRNRYDSLTTPTAYVDGLLQTVGLPTHPGRSGWIQGLTNGSLTRAQVLRQVTESGEVQSKYFNEAFVIMQYFGYLRRSADASYLTWIQTMNSNGGNYRVMINGFVNSPEYRLRFGP